MRILIVSQYFWPENFTINTVTRSLLEKGIDLEVLTGKPNYPQGNIFPRYRAWGCQRERYEGIAINRIPLLARGNSRWRLALNYISFILSGLLFAPWMLRRKKYDVIFIYAPSPILQALPAIFVGRLKHCPVVLWVQDLWPESLSATGHVQNRWVLKLVELVVRFIYRHTDMILIQSKAFELPIRRLASATPIRHQANSVDAAFSGPPECAIPVPVVDGLDSGFSVMFAGNIGKAQGVGIIVDVSLLLKEYCDIHFVVLGDGSDREWMLNQAQQKGLNNLHLPGSFPVESMPGFMAKASALLVTLVDKEIFAATVPNKVQAYLAAGRPILASLNGEGARLVNQAGAGLTSPAEDAKALADIILQLYRLSPDERRKMGDNGHRFYQKHFDHDFLIDQLIKHLQLVSVSGESIR